MARPKTYADERVETSVKLPRDLLGKLNKAAKERDLGRNRLVERAIEEYLKQLSNAKT